MTRTETKSNTCDFISKKHIKNLVLNETRHNFMSNLYSKALGIARQISHVFLQ